MHFVYMGSGDSGTSLLQGGRPGQQYITAHQQQQQQCQATATVVAQWCMDELVYNISSLAHPSVSPYLLNRNQHIEQQLQVSKYSRYRAAVCIHDLYAAVVRTIEYTAFWALSIGRHT